MSRSARYKSSLRWTPVEAEAALAELRSSGLTVSAFARQEGLHPRRVLAWKKRLEAKPSLPSREAFVEVVPRSDERIEVVLRTGVVLRVAETVEPNALRRIVEALEDRDQC